MTFGLNKYLLKIFFQCCDHFFLIVVLSTIDFDVIHQNLLLVSMVLVLLPSCCHCHVLCVIISS